MASAIRARLMEDMMSCQQACCERPAALGMRKDSHMISKMKPKVRIVHIFAPEIIKTDVENFRELVQRLTGKPKKRDGGKKKKAAAEPMGTRQGAHGVSWYGEMVKGDLQEEKSELWKDQVSSGGFLSGFGDHVDAGFFHGLGDWRPTLLPSSSSDMAGHVMIGEAHI